MIGLIWRHKFFGSPKNFLELAGFEAHNHWSFVAGAFRLRF